MTVDAEPPITVVSVFVMVSGPGLFVWVWITVFVEVGGTCVADADALGTPIDALVINYEQHNIPKHTANALTNVTWYTATAAKLCWASHRTRRTLAYTAAAAGAVWTASDVADGAIIDGCASSSCAAALVRSSDGVTA